MPDDNLQWRDGQPWSARFSDRYFSAASGPDEKRHVFLQGNRLAERWSAWPAGACFRIGETGFGTGLGFLCARQLFEQQAPPGATLSFHSVERWPLAPAELQAALAPWPGLQAGAADLCAAWGALAPGRHAWQFGAVRLELDIGDAAAVLAGWPSGAIDAWFLDGFAPARNPDMWSAAVLAEVARCARPGGTLATFTSAGAVRRGLQAAGFAVRRVPGYGAKREMLVAQRAA